jgi:hypothetical protein
VITVKPISPTFNTDRLLGARIVQNSGPLNASLRVRCEFYFKTPPSLSPNVRSIDAERVTENDFECRLPTTSVIRNNHVLVFEWMVESVNSQGQATPVAASGENVVHLGCSDPVQALRDLQTSVLSRFGGAPMTRSDLLLAGYIPAHSAPELATMPGQIVPGDKVFKGMGVAYVRASDVLASQNLAPSTISLDMPSLLLLLPSATGFPPDVAPPSATYSLIGWAYAVNLSTLQACLRQALAAYQSMNGSFTRRDLTRLMADSRQGSPSSPGVRLMHAFGISISG